MGVQKTWATVIGAILLLTGIVGFFMSSPLFGIFGVNTLHNLVHVLTGIVFLWGGLSKSDMAMPVNKWLGVVYIVVGIVGFFGVLSFLMVMGGNDPDNYLHLGVGVVSALIGWMAK
jgi:hypothetical protein